jgi:hypothetical protein
MTAETLLEAAASLPPAGKHPTDTVLPAVELMRAKGYTFRAIHKFLMDQGAHVHSNPNTFTSVMARRLARKRKKGAM